MTLLIDGYNLLHGSGVFPPAASEPTLERARAALLDALLEALPPKEVARTTVVFDAVAAPPGLPREVEHRGLAVRFARRGGTADELLEELIAAEPDPRHVLVVSSDHRVQRAARQCGARFTDSEAWWKDQQRASSSPPRIDPVQELKRAGKLANPFPPGYAEDVLKDGS